MTTKIFADNAPKYWEAGLQAIPLYPMSKRPMMNDWSQFADKKISVEDRDQWITQNGNSNIGLVLGPASGLMMIDIDTEDESVFKALVESLPHSAWARKGRKGIMLAYRYNGVKTFRIKDASGSMIVECLSARTQCVLPGSIHPDSRLPYTSNTNLWEVLNQLVPLPDNIEEVLRTVLHHKLGIELSHSGWSKVTEFVSSGARDTTLTEMAGLFAYAVVRGERTLKEAIGMLRSYHSEFIEHAAGDLMDIDKHVANLIKFLERDVIEKGKVLPTGWDAEISEFEKKSLGLTLGKEHTEWRAQEIIEFLHKSFEAKLERAERTVAVEEILLRISRSPSISRIDEDQILKYIVEVSSLGVPIATYRARLKELRQGDITGADHSEIARAVLKDLEQYNLVRFYAGKFMKWAGSHWIEIPYSTIQGHVSNRYGHLIAARKSSDISGIVKVMSFLAENEIKKNPVRGVNFANGYLTEELRLMPHDPDYGMTYTLPFRYLPELAGRYPMFDSFLQASWGRDNDYTEKLLALQEVLAVTLFGMGSKFQRAVLLHGPAKTGKTQLLRIVQSLVPSEGRCSLSPESWGDKFLTVVMFNKILNISGELSEKKINGQLFKDIIDGSERPMQYKNGQIFQAAPVLTHWFASNHLPKTDDTSHGFIRRWIMLTFNTVVKDKETKLDLGDSIAAEEREAIVAWAAQAILRLRNAQTLTMPRSHHDLEREFANVNNSVRMFMLESGKVRVGVHGEFTTETKAFNTYWSWCSVNGGSKPVSLIKFRMMMRELQTQFDINVVVKETTTGGMENVFENMVVKV